LGAFHFIYTAQTARDPSETHEILPARLALDGFVGRLDSVIAKRNERAITTDTAIKSRPFLVVELIPAMLQFLRASKRQVINKLISCKQEIQVT